jgi:menaquinone-specific isochorismate synthase
MSDDKERWEHDLVVRTVEETLTAVCSDLSVPPSPTLAKMANIQHLYTPIEGNVNTGITIFDLAQRLHPTPAMGGLPRERAIDLIRSYESFDRGWYAGPIGWVDGNGEGEFAVAIRSALLKENEATLYAGCGIVADSDPEREYRESELKLQSMLWALNATQS